jgi:hypothetical protein
MLQCNRYPGLDANEIIRLTSAIGQQETVTVFRATSAMQRLRSLTAGKPTSAVGHNRPSTTSGMPFSERQIPVPEAAVR